MSNVVLSGPDATMFSIDFSVGTAPCNGLSIVIAGGQNCTLGITFAPQSDGARSASLVITSDDGDEGTVSIALSGTGITPAADDTPAPTGGGGGGCTLRSKVVFDPLLPLMLLVSGFYLWQRRSV